MGPDLGGALHRGLGLGHVLGEDGLAGGEELHVGGVLGCLDLRSHRGGGEVLGAGRDLVEVLVDVGEVALVADALELAQVAPELEHDALLGRVVALDDGLVLAEEIGLLQALEGAVDLALPVEVVDRAHADGDVVYGLAAQAVERLEGGDVVRDGEELLHLLGADADVLVLGLEHHAVEGAGHDAMAVAAGQEVLDDLGLELDLRLEGEGRHAGLVGDDLGLGLLLLLHPEAELGRAGGRLHEGAALALLVALLGALVVGDLHLLAAVHHDALLLPAQGLELVVVHAHVAELDALLPDLADLRGEGQRVLAVLLVAGGLEEEIEGLLLVGRPGALVDDGGGEQGLDAGQEREVAGGLLGGRRRGEVALEAGAHHARVAEVEGLALPLHGAVLHVDGVAVDVEEAVGHRLAAAASVVAPAAAGDGRAGLAHGALGEAVGGEQGGQGRGQEGGQGAHGGVRRSRGPRPRGCRGGRGA